MAATTSNDGDDDELEELVLQCLGAEEPLAELDRRTASRPHLKAAAVALLQQVDRLEQLAPAGHRDWRLGERLGGGGMGIVYAAVHVHTGEAAALKLVRPECLAFEEGRVRFAREIDAVRRLDHPGIVRVLDHGLDDGVPWYAMERVVGRPLAAILEQHRGAEPTSLDGRALGRAGTWTIAAIALVAQVARALAHAHERGVVHRDIKPSNIMVGDDGQARLIDFGLARVTATESLTRTGIQPGSLAYMSPEQARGEKVDLRTDVWSLGVVLYELLTLRQPFLGPTEAATRTAILGAAPPPVERSNGTIDGRLASVLAAAMAPEVAHRCQTCEAFAADLEAWLAGGAVRARPPGPWLRAKRFARRRPAMATGMVLGAAVALVLPTVVLLQERSARRQIEQKVAEFDLLAGVVRRDRAIANEELLHPPWPHRVAALQGWLDDDCAPLLAMRTDIERTLESLRQEAQPPDDSQRQRDVATHPDHARWQSLGRRLAAMRHAHAVRSGHLQLTEPALTAEQQGLSAGTLHAMAWDRVSPSSERRVVGGEEALGLAMARLAVTKARGSADESMYLETLAWALLANGQDDEAKRCSSEALATVATSRRDAYERDHQRLLDAVDRAGAVLTALEAEHATLSAEVQEPRSWVFPANRESARFLHDTLVGLRIGLSALERVQKAAIVQRLAWARRIGGLTRAHPRARVTWDAARTAIAQNPRYADRSIPLRDEDVIGLVPIGENPATGLWEFYDLRSAWDGEADAATLPIPEHLADGSIEVTRDTGIVLVLLPGGRTRIGAQSADGNGHHHDPAARPDEGPVFEVTLDPFLLGKHELTQSQWARLWNGDESLRWPSQYRIGQNPAGVRAITPMNPVEHVDWAMCERLLRQHGMVIPTEAQWEYGCRAGTSAPWSCKPGELQLHGNFADLTAKPFTDWPCVAWEDGHVVHAPVGSFRANPFGLHDVHGNVTEWCQEMYDVYGRERDGDGLGDRQKGSGDRIGRGGAFGNIEAGVRSSERIGIAVGARDGSVGVRPARVLRK